MNKETKNWKQSIKTKCVRFQSHACFKKKVPIQYIRKISYFLCLCLHFSSSWNAIWIRTRSQWIEAYLLWYEFDARRLAIYMHNDYCLMFAPSYSVLQFFWYLPFFCLSIGFAALCCWFLSSAAMPLVSCFQGNCSKSNQQFSIVQMHRFKIKINFYPKAILLHFVVETCYSNESSIIPTISLSVCVLCNEHEQIVSLSRQKSMLSRWTVCLVGLIEFNRSVHVDIRNAWLCLQQLMAGLTRKMKHDFAHIHEKKVQSL